jgi:hypothetical protein
MGKAGGDDGGKGCASSGGDKVADFFKMPIFQYCNYSHRSNAQWIP